MNPNLYERVKMENNIRLTFGLFAKFRFGKVHLVKKMCNQCATCAIIVQFILGRKRNQLLFVHLTTIFFYLSDPSTLWMLYF
jgi:hypothetical protein